MVSAPGTIIHHSKDNYGDLFVVDDQGKRTLFFDNKVRQTSIPLENQSQLSIPYTEVMMGALLFHPQPSRVLFIGLGGGAMVRFLLRTFPECRIEAVELREEVIRIAYSYFGIPQDRKRLIVHLADGRDWISDIASSASSLYDLIFIDAFEADGPSEINYDLQFLMNCYKLLRNQGSFVINLWTRSENNYPWLRAALKTVFNNRILHYRTGKSKGNAVAFGFKDRSDITYNVWRKRARELSKITGINLSRFLGELKRQNNALGTRKNLFRRFLPGSCQK